MNYDRGIGFIGGIVLGGVFGSALALLLAPTSGQETREQIRFEGVALKHRGQVYGDDRKRQARRMVKQGQRRISHAQADLNSAINVQKDNLRDAVTAGNYARQNS